MGLTVWDLPTTERRVLIYSMLSRQGVAELASQTGSKAR